MKHMKALALSALLVTVAIALDACRGGNRNTDSAYGGTTTGAATSMGASTGAMSMDSMHRDTTRRDTSTKRP